MSAQRCRFRFFGDLNDFLPVTQRGRWIPCDLDGFVAVKHSIEALGIPHPEVGQIVIDGTSVAFTRRLVGGELVRVYSHEYALPDRGESLLRPPLARPPRFVLDTHLGRLAAYIRVLGFDTVYRNDFDDATLASIAHDDRRVLLTRDRGLLKRSVVDHGYCVRQSKPRAQLVDVVRRFGLAEEAVPWQRCVRCNGLLEPIDKAAILERLEPKTRVYYDDFQRCSSCGQIYWRGSHHERMSKVLADMLQEARRPAHAAGYTGLDRDVRPAKS